MNNFFVFTQLIHRDLYVFKRRLANYGINYLVILPLLSIITFGYIQPGVFFGAGVARTSVILLIGMFIVNMLSLCYNMLSPFIYDLEAERFIEYQILLLDPRLLLLQMLLVPACMATVISLPFFPLARMLLPHYFTDLATNWYALTGMIVCIAFFCAAYIMLAMCVIKTSLQVRQFWIRCNWPLMVLGGFWLPWHMLAKFSVPLSYVALLDPFTYMTEGLRSSLIGSNAFIHYGWCMMALVLFTSLIIACTLPLFKRKLDHI